MVHDLSLLTKFAIAMAMVLLLPRLAERIKLPGVLGFIAAGAVLGPGLTGVLSGKGEAVHLFSELGKLLFMFFMGFSIELEEFNKNRARSAVFGALTFGMPFAGGLLLGRIAGYEWNTAILIGSIIASHTLLAFPILKELKLVGRDSVLVTIGGTLFTDVAAMIVLAVVVAVHQTGFSWRFLLIEMVELAVFVPFVLFGLSKIARKAIIHFGETASARVMILLLVIAAAAELAHLINLEGIVGAFLAGIAVKRALRGKFAVEQLEVLANALFVPAFFLTTGFLVDFSLLAKTLTSNAGMVIGLIGALAVGKVVAAGISGKLFAYGRTESLLMFSLTLPQMAATLASAVVGYQCVNQAGVRLLDSEFVNAVLFLVVVTCVAGPVLTSYWGKRAGTKASGQETSDRSTS